MQALNLEIAKVREFVNILQSDYFPDLTDENFKIILNRKVSNWETSTQIYLENSNPLKKHRSKLNIAEWDLKAHDACEESIFDDLSNYKLLHPSVNVSFWEQKILAAKKKRDETANNSITKNLNVIRRNEQEAWEKEYNQQLLEWQIMEVQKLRAQLLKDLKKWIETIQQMKEVFDKLDVDPELLWDLSACELSEQDISFLKQWAEYLNKAENIRKLCELMGRLRREEESDRTEIINSTIQYCVRKPDISSNEMVVGIELGRDLENVIPQELALLSDSDVALLFDLKYVENRLMCFSKQGYKNEIIEETIQQTITVVDEDKMGPIIICVDSSNSMTGAPEYIAKALTLSLVSRAVSQNRKCYLINFSTSIDTLDLTPPKGIPDLIDFLKMSFHGGTDVVPALYEGLRMMQDENYEKADLLVISDFVFSYLPPEMVSLCKEQKQNENRFFAVAISPFETNRVDDKIFDKGWKYNTRVGSLSEIKNDKYILI